MNCGSTSSALPSLLRSTRNANSVGPTASISVSIHGPTGFAGILQPDDLPRKVRDLYDIGVTVAVDIDRKVAEVVDVAAVEWDVADSCAWSSSGASYQYSAERMSSRPSLLKSATATDSLKPGSTMCTLKAISSGRLMLEPQPRAHLCVNQQDQQVSDSSRTSSGTTHEKNQEQFDHRLASPASSLEPVSLTRSVLSVSSVALSCCPCHPRLTSTSAATRAAGGRANRARPNCGSTRARRAPATPPSLPAPAPS